MKKVLILSYYFPPVSTIGSQRPYKLAKYFPQNGWEPIILTSPLPGKPPEGMRVIETDYKDVLASLKSKLGFAPNKGLHEQLNIKISKNFNYDSLKSKITKLLKQSIAFPDEQIGWFKFALNAAETLVHEERIDAMISTSYPVTSHLIARDLKRKYKIPWVADFRDLWTQNHYNDKFEIIRYFERRLELKTISNADALVTVSNPLVDTLKSLHKNKKIFRITNGYDTDDFTISTSKLTSKFTITYTGTLYNGKRDPSILFGVVEQLINEKRIKRELIEIKFFGRDETWLHDEVKKYNLEDVVNIYDYVPREEALLKQKESQLLLLLLWNNKNEEGVYTGKVFEYLGTRRPIIALGGYGGVVKDLLEITNAGKFAENEEKLKNILLEYYQEFIEAGEIKCNSNNDINNYRYEHIAKKYSEILNAVSMK